MANDYFDAVPLNIPAGTRARASQVNAVSQAIEAGFDKLPTEEQLKEGTARYAVDTGAANAYVVTLPYAITLEDGVNLYFKAVNANTGPTTINVNGTGVKAIRNVDGTELIANTFGNNTLAQIIYNATSDTWQLLTQSPEAEQAKIAAEAAAAAAAVSEANAATSETNAANSAAAAATSESNAATSETNAAASETAADASFVSFDKRYLGAKTSDPTLDNQGAALQDGALYYNTNTNETRVYDLGTTNWIPLNSNTDALTLQGLAPSQFVRSDANASLVGNYDITGQLTVDNVDINGNTIAAVTGALTINAAVGSAVVVEGVSHDGGSITLTGTVDGRDVATDGTKLDGIENNATQDQTDVEIETAYNNQVAAATQLEMETGTEAAIRRLSPLRVAQAIAALSPATNPGGIDSQVQYNNGGAFGGSSAFTFNDTTNVLTATNVRALDDVLLDDGRSSQDGQPVARIGAFPSNVLYDQIFSRNVQINHSSGALTAGRTGDGYALFGMKVDVADGDAYMSVGGSDQTAGNGLLEDARVTLRGGSNPDMLVGFDTGSGVTTCLTLGKGTIRIGNALPGVTGVGLIFPSTANPSTGTTTLDDYREGTFTPVISDGTNNATMAAGNKGRYVKIGRTVFISMDVFTSSLGAVTGSIRITGLPFTCVAGDASAFGFSCVNGGGLTLGAAGQQITAIPSGASTFALLRTWSSTGGTVATQATEWTADGRVTFVGQYETDD